MMKKVFVILIALFAVATAASAANYKLDDEAIDLAIENAVDVSPFAVMSETAAALPSAPATTMISAEKSPVAAILLSSSVASVYIVITWAPVPGCGLSIPSQ